MSLDVELNEVDLLPPKDLLPIVIQGHHVDLGGRERKRECKWMYFWMHGINTRGEGMREIRGGRASNRLHEQTWPTLEVLSQLRVVFPTLLASIAFCVSADMGSNKLHGSGKEGGGQARLNHRAQKKIKHVSLV